MPEVLKKTGKIKNPDPNVDVFSGCLLNHFGTQFTNLGIKEYEYYSVVFAISRAMGILSSGIWARAYGLPIERPNSISVSFL